MTIHLDSDHLFLLFLNKNYNTNDDNYYCFYHYCVIIIIFSINVTEKFSIFFSMTCLPGCMSSCSVFVSFSQRPPRMETQSESGQSQAWLGSPWSTLRISAQGYGEHPTFSLADSEPVIHMQLLSSVRLVDTVHTDKAPDSFRGGTDRHLPLLGPPGPGAAEHGGARPDPDRRLRPGETGVLLRPHHELSRPGETHSREGKHPLPCHPTLHDSGQGTELPGGDSSP